MTSQVSMERIDYAKNAVETVGELSMYPSIYLSIYLISHFVYIDQYLKPHKKINSKWIQVLSIKTNRKSTM